MDRQQETRSIVAVDASEMNIRQFTPGLCRGGGYTIADVAGALGRGAQQRRGRY